MPHLEEIIGGIPPITRWYLILSVVLMGLCSLDLLSPFHLYLNWNLVFQKAQVSFLLIFSPRTALFVSSFGALYHVSYFLAILVYTSFGTCICCKLIP